MSRTLKQWGDDFERRPARTARRMGCWVVAVVAGLMVIGAGLSIFGFFTGAASNAVSTTKKEFYPDALLRKYEWFKNAAAALDEKVATIKVYDARLGALASAYTGEPRGKWPRDDREAFNLWASELAGIKASHNDLAADYNAQMSKFNWRFTNVGDLPPGATTPLPREFKPYVTE